MGVAITDEVVDAEFDVVFDDEHDSGGDDDNGGGDDDAAGACADADNEVFVLHFRESFGASKPNVSNVGLHLSLFEGDAWGEIGGVMDEHSALLPIYSFASIRCVRPFFGALEGTS